MMVSLEQMIQTFGDKEMFGIYNTEADNNEGMYFLGGELPIKKTDKINKIVVENVQKMITLKGKTGNVVLVYNNFRKAYMSLLSFKQN